MAILENKAKTTFISLQIYESKTNFISNETEYLCNFTIKTTLFTLSANKHESCYISQSQINYIKKYFDNFNYDSFNDEEEFFSFYPITMFVVIDFFKHNKSSVYVNLKSPIEIFDLQGEYKIGLDFEMSLLNFIDFFQQLIEETNSISKYRWSNKKV